MDTKLEYKYKTDDMALVTYLRMVGHSAVEVRWIGNSCWWLYDSSAELMLEVESFTEGDATKFKDFSRLFKRTHSEFHDSRNGRNARRSSRTPR